MFLFPSRFQMAAVFGCFSQSGVEREDYYSYETVVRSTSSYLFLPLPTSSYLFLPLPTSTSSPQVCAMYLSRLCQLQE